jgi:hypothetical protein
MPTIRVYKNYEQVAHETIYEQYSIIESYSGEKIFWFENEPCPPGVIKIWLQLREEGLLLCYVLPDWQLIIDGVWMEKKFYQDIKDIAGKEVELRYKEYRFLFQF